jgi:hypothetical protein
MVVTLFYTTKIQQKSYPTKHFAVKKRIYFSKKYAPLHILVERSVSLRSAKNKAPLCLIISKRQAFKMVCRFILTLSNLILYSDGRNIKIMT